MEGTGGGTLRGAVLLDSFFGGGIGAPLIGPGAGAGTGKVFPRA